jgi:hypothetical protein
MMAADCIVVRAHLKLSSSSLVLRSQAAALRTLGDLAVPAGADTDALPDLDIHTDASAGLFRSS